MLKKDEISQYLQALDGAAEVSGINIAGSARQKCLSFIDLLLEWNRKMNLTAITDPEGIAIRHFADSWTIQPWLDRFIEETEHNPFRMIDIGTGAGFPGIPLKILNPAIELVLLDSLKKRINFLQTVANNLELSNVLCLHSRAEDAARDQKLRDKFDLATARAVASLPVLCELCLPLVRSGGYFIAMKSRSSSEVEQASAAIRKLGGQLYRVEDFKLPGTDMQRSLVIIKKISATSETFPRKAGIPQREPL